MVARALEYTEVGTTAQRILARAHLSDGIEEFTVHSPLIAAAAQAGQFVRLLPRPDGELIPLTLADWDVEAGTICLVVQGVGTSSIEINQIAMPVLSPRIKPLRVPPGQNRVASNPGKNCRKAIKAIRPIW